MNHYQIRVCTWKTRLPPQLEFLPLFLFPILIPIPSRPNAIARTHSCSTAARTTDELDRTHRTHSQSQAEHPVQRKFDAKSSIRKIKFVRGDHHRRHIFTTISCDVASLPASITAVPSSRNPPRRLLSISASRHHSSYVHSHDVHDLAVFNRYTDPIESNS